MATKKIKVKGGGVKEAAKLVAALDLKEQEKILEHMQKIDPKMSALIQKNLVRLEDLSLASEKMLAEFLRAVSLKDFGLALRLIPKEGQEIILSRLSQNMVSEIKEGLLGPPVSLNMAQGKMQTILDIMQEWVKQGKLVLKIDDRNV